VAALGDTFSRVFPGARPAQDASPTASFLIRLRILIRCSRSRRPPDAYLASAPSSCADAAVKSWTRRVTGLFSCSGMVGVANVGLLAPLPLQMLHLLLADLVWVAAVLLCAVALAEEPAAAVAPEGWAAAPT